MDPDEYDNTMPGVYNIWLLMRCVYTFRQVDYRRVKHIGFVIYFIIDKIDFFPFSIIFWTGEGQSEKAGRIDFRSFITT